MTLNRTLRAQSKVDAEAMGRPRRAAEPGDFFHVCTRGNNRRDIYADTADRLVFLKMLDRCRARHDWRIYAWCLMTTHYHVVLATPEGGLSDGMCRLNGGFARSFNKRRGREDHLFGKRFLSTTIKDDRHLLEAIRYVVLNPVRAGLCDDPGAWRWSSYNASAGVEAAPPLLALGELLALFGVDPGPAVASFQTFVREGIA